MQFFNCAKSLEALEPV